MLMEFLNQNHEDFVDMKSRAKGQPVLSYIATKSAAKLYDEIIDGQLKEAFEASQKAEEKRTEVEKNSLKRANNAMKLEVRKNIERHKEEFDEAQEALAVMAAAGTQPGASPQSLNMKDSMELLRKMKSNRNVKEIMKLIGKFQNLAKHKLMTSHEGCQSIVGVKMGNEISELLPEEFEMLFDEDFEALKMLELIQEQLFQWKGKAKTPKTGGPFVVCLDETGSMRGRLIENAKAFLFGLWEVAKAEKREFVLIRFGGAGEIKTGKINSVSDLMEVMESFMNASSTDFETPLAAARAVIENGGEFDKADIVFITDDGGCRLSSAFVEDFNEFRKATKTKVVSLALVPSATMVRKFSDQVVYGFEGLADATF